MLRGTLGLALTATLAGCEAEIVPDKYLPTSAHDGYRHALSEAELLDTALGRDWTQAADNALRSPVAIRPPFRESFYIDRSDAFATGYRFSVKRGQRIEVKLDLAPPSDWRLFLDLFRVGDEQGAAPVHVASGGEGDLRLAFEPRRDGDYVVRIQSELLRGGSCTVEIRNVASLEFPVSGHDTSSIGSRFGASREGGRREHHGVDIFAPRHTEVRATSRARVRRVDDWRLGGRVIWLEDPERDLRIYFAHLETQEAIEGTWVVPGQRIGTVGNSGNARSTPPHLHFGVYAQREGPIDPYHFLYQPHRDPPSITVDLDALGTWVRTKRTGARLKLTYYNERPLEELGGTTPLLVTGGTGRDYRVELPNGMIGYVAAGEIEAIETSLQSVQLTKAQLTRDRPSGDAAVVRRLDAGSQLNIFATYDGYALVSVNDRRAEWLSDGSLQ
ncbi:MAG TPA: M23 family metallopeptidase [Vicinamibacteria bacterium]|nr:M23 family metallopeptidase [Vicinamibacteria bacterium]